MRNIRITKKKGTEHSLKSQKNKLSKIEQTPYPTMVELSTIPQFLIIYQPL